MRTTYTFIKFECTKCKENFEVLHDTSAEPPPCPKCGKETIEVVSANDYSGGHSVSFRGLSTPGSNTSIRSTMPKGLKEKWLSRRQEQFKRTGK